MYQLHRGPRPRGPIVGQRVTFYVSNRRLIPDLSIVEPYIVISVSSPDRPEAVLMESEHLRGVLRLSFHDRAEAGDDTVLFGESEARRILDFVAQHHPDVRVIVTQCAKGNSRSAAIAAALSRIIQQDDQYIRQCFMPNRRVRETLLEAARKLDRGW